MRFMMLVIPKGYESAQPDQMPDAAAVAQDDEIQRGPRECGRPAQPRRPQAAIGRRARQLRGRQAESHRRSVRGSEGMRRRLLDDPGQVEGRSHRVGQARADVATTRSSRCARSTRWRTSPPTCRRPPPASRKCSAGNNGSLGGDWTHPTSPGRSTRSGRSSRRS